MILGHPSFSVQPTGAQVQNKSLFFCMRQNMILLHNGHLPTWEQVQPFLPEDFLPFELAHTDESTIVAPHPYQEFEFSEKAGLQYYDVNIFRELPLDQASLITSSLHLWKWYANNRFCGRCGAVLKPDANERALRCSECGNLLFPVIAPAVIVAITCGNRILLARNQRYQHYALIAGYVEVGETLEHALRREVMEEVGLEIHDIHYLGDQPWGISGSHMFAFHALADDSAPLTIQASELKDARWFNREEVQPLQHKVSIAYELMERFRKGIL